MEPKEALQKLFRTAEEFVVGTFANVPPLKLPEEENEFLKMNYLQLVCYRRRKIFPHLSPEKRRQYDEALEMTLHTREKDRQYQAAQPPKGKRAGAYHPGGGRVLRSTKSLAEL